MYDSCTVFLTVVFWGIFRGIREILESLIIELNGDFSGILGGWLKNLGCVDEPDRAISCAKMLWKSFNIPYI